MLGARDMPEMVGIIGCRARPTQVRRLADGLLVVGMDERNERLEPAAERSRRQAVLRFQQWGPSKHPGGVVQVPDPDACRLQRKPGAFLGGRQRLGVPVAFDADRQVVRQSTPGLL